MIKKNISFIILTLILIKISSIGLYLLPECQTITVYNVNVDLVFCLIYYSKGFYSLGSTQTIERPLTAVSENFFSLFLTGKQKRKPGKLFSLFSPFCLFLFSVLRSQSWFPSLPWFPVLAPCLGSLHWFRVFVPCNYCRYAPTGVESQTHTRPSGQRGTCTRATAYIEDVTAHINPMHHVGPRVQTSKSVSRLATLLSLSSVARTLASTCLRRRLPNVRKGSNGHFVTIRCVFCLFRKNLMVTIR